MNDLLEYEVEKRRHTKREDQAEPPRLAPFDAHERHDHQSGTVGIMPITAMQARNARNQPKNFAARSNIVLFGRLSPLLLATSM